MSVLITISTKVKKYITNRTCTGNTSMLWKWKWFILDHSRDTVESTVWKTNIFTFSFTYKFIVTTHAGKISYYDIFFLKEGIEIIHFSLFFCFVNIWTLLTTLIKSLPCNTKITLRISICSCYKFYLLYCPWHHLQYLGNASHFPKSVWQIISNDTSNETGWHKSSLTGTIVSCNSQRRAA